MSNPLDVIVRTMEKAREFMEYDFILGAEGGESVMSPPRKQALATWQSFYHTTINGPGQIVNRLLPIVSQCKVVEADSLRTSKIHMVRQMSRLKIEFDSSFEKLLDRLNNLTGEVLVKALGDNPMKADKYCLNGYWLELQLEVAQKIAKLTKFQNDLNLHCHSILAKVDYADLTGLIVSQGPSANLPSTRRFAPNPAFIPQDCPKSWYTTASDTITDTEVKVISK